MPTICNENDTFHIAGVELSSRLLLGTAGYPTQDALLRALEASSTELVTVSIRRLAVNTGSNTSLLQRLKTYRLLPNTAGCETAQDAILTAELAREALGTNWIKVEVIGNPETLYPNVTELVKACQVLIERNFVVLPYCNDDPVICKFLEEIGCAAVMPMASLIGSGLGVVNPFHLEMICKQSSIPVIVDAGIGTASDTVKAMELGASACLINTAIAKAKDPVTMAGAMRDAVQAGRLAYRAGRIPAQKRAEPSSPQYGLIGG